MELFIQDFYNYLVKCDGNWNRLEVQAKGASFFSGSQVEAGAAESTAGAGSVVRKSNGSGA